MATLLKRLVPEKLRRLIAIKQELPGTALNNLPETVRHEVTAILTSAVNSAANGAAHNGRRNGATATVPKDTATLTQASQAERDSYWKNQPHTTAREQMQEWERRIDSWIAELHADPATWEQFAFLQRLLAEDKNGQAQAPALPAGRQVAVSAQALYRTFFKGEGNGDIEYFFQRIVRTNTAEQIRHNANLIQSLAEMYGSETGKRALPLILARKTSHHQNGHTAPRDYSKIYSTLGTDIETGEVAVISESDRAYALASFGAIGSGKSTFALNLILQDCRQNRGVILTEPHGDLTRAVLAGIPESRLDDVVYLDLTDCATFPFGLNPFQCDTLQDAAEVAKCANFVHHTFMRTWDFGQHTPVLAMVLRHVTRTLIENPGSSFADIPLLFHEDTAREKLVSNVTAAAPHTKAFWQRYNTLSPRERRELISSTENKIDAYLSEPLIANILSQAKTTIDFGALLNEGKIVLLNLSPQLEEISRLLGSLVLGRILMSAYQRASVPESERVPCHVYVDEWSRFCSDDLAVLIAESRKFKVFIGGLFNQTLETISDSNRATALQVGSLVTFRVSGDDSAVMARSYNCEPEKVQEGFEPQRALASDVITHLVNRGHNDPKVAAFAQRTLQVLEHFVKTPTSPAVAYAKQWHASYDCFDGTLSLSDLQVQEGRKLLNQTLYACMSEANPNLYIPMLAIYILAAAQRDGREYVFSPHIKHYNHGFFFGPFSLEAFEESARKFGEAWFVEPQRSARYIASVAKYAKKEQWMAEAVVSMLTELRYVISVLAQSPILIDTGHMVPKYKLRTYADQENSIANDISTLKNFHAKVRLPSGREHTIRTHPAPPLLPEAQVNERIRQIKHHMREQGLIKPVHEVEEEVRIRHERLRQRNDEPPPSSTTGRPPRRLRHKSPSSFT